ncbi:MAG: phosphonate metabolism transcriptional regulator PhnF [Burkholderiaceae bacterium]|jgi:GntR family phosphonate transport system transcriptional regulator|nr:phosphonate metabolism transcriptional regulator PhnF [Burkholderiaceae bacterium]
MTTRSSRKPRTHEVCATGNPFELEAATPALARAGGVTMWKQIEQQLALEIRDRRFVDSGRLPSENELAERFAVNRHTLRQALSALQQSGLVRIERGRGAFIQQDWVDYTLARRTRFSENVLQNRLQPSMQLLAAREVAASEKVARALALSRGSRVLQADVLDEAGGAPIACASMFFPAARFVGLLERLQQTTRISAVLSEFGVADYFRSHNRITTQLPDEETARLLRQPRTRPVLVVESIDVDPQGVPIKYGETLFSGDRVQLVVDPAATEGSAR